MEEHGSVAKIVQQITETLSDAVAQLVVLVVALQEQNAEMPPTLPMAAQAVGGASNTLVGVARSLAEEEYSDFPDICGQILNAADGVEQAAAAMIVAVQAVATARDRQAGWSQLVECCKIIAGKTIILLQIVYGADLYRLFACSDQTNETLNRLDIKLAVSDPQTFANLAGEAATRANQLSEYVRAKAADTDSPMLQASLAEAAAMLQQDSNDLIEAANALLQDPSNEANQKKLNLQLAAVKAHIKKVTDPLQEDLDTVSQDLERLQNATRGDKQSFDTLFAAPKPAPGQKAPAQDLADEPVVLMAYRGAGLTEKLESAARQGDAGAVAAASKELDDTNKQLHAGVALAASTLDDPLRKKRLMTAMDELEQLVPIQRAMAQQTLKDPKKQKELHQANYQLKTKYDDIADILRPGAATAAAIADYKEAAERAKIAAEKGDAAALDAALESLLEATETLRKRAEARAAGVDDPLTRKEVSDALLELQRLAPLQTAAAKRLVKAPRDRQAQNDLADSVTKAQAPLTVMEAIADPTGEREIVVAAEQSEKESDKMLAAARSGDKDAVADAAKRLTRYNIKLAKQARAKAARLEDPVKRKELLAAVDELERLLPEQINAASEMANNPRDQAKADQLLAITDLVLAQIAQVEATVESAAPVAAAARREKKKLAALAEALNKGDPKDTEAALKALQNANDLLLQLGREEQNNKVDPHRRKELSNALDELEQLLPLQVKAAKDAKDKPRDAAAKKAVLEINGLLSNAVDEVVRKAIPIPKDRAATAVAQSLDELDRLLEAIKREDPQKAAMSIRGLATNGVRLGDEARNLAQGTDDPIKRKEIFGAIDELERMLPLQMAAAREAVANPKDKAKQAQLDDMSERLRDALEALLTALADNDDEAAATAANQQAREVERLSNAAREGDARAVEMAAKSLAKKQPKLAKQARARAAKTDDPEQKRDILATLELLESLIPRQIRAAKEAIANPDDEQKRQQLEDINGELISAYQELSAVMLPVEGAQALVTAVAKENQAMEQLRNAVQMGDLANGEDALRNLEDALRQIAQNAKTELIRSDDDPKGKRNLNDAINELEALLVKLRPLAMAALANPKDKKALKALTDELDRIASTSDKILENSKAVPLAAAQRQERDVEKLALAARNSDPQAIAATARSLARRAPKLAEQARKTDDPARKKAILAVVEELERLLPMQVAASLAVASNPDDGQAKKALDKYDRLGFLFLHLKIMTKHYSGLLNTLEVAIRPDNKDKVPEAAERELANLIRLLEQTKKGDARGVEETLRHLEQDNDLIAQHGRAEAGKNPNAKALREAVNDLENLMALIRDCARAGLKTPNDKRSYDDLEECAKRLGDRVNELAEHMDPTYRNKKEREVSRAILDLESIMPRLNDARERLARDHNDRKAMDDLEEIITRSQLPIEVIERSKPQSLEEEVMQSRLREKEALSNLEEEARRGNLEGIETEARKAAMAQETLVDRARQRAEESNDPAKRKRMLDAINDLERLLPETIRASRRLAQKPSDASSKKDLSELNLMMLAALDQSEREIVPSVEAVVLEAVQRLAQDTDKLLNSVQAGDERNAVGAMNELEEMMNNVMQQANAAAAVERDPRTKKDLLDAVASLEGLLAQIRPNLLSATRRPADRKSQALLTQAARGLATSINHIADALKAEAVVEAQVQQATISRLSAAAKRKDPRDLAEATKAMAANHKKLTEQAREEASRSSDPARKRQIMDAVTELDNLLPRQVIAVKESLQNPGSEEKLDALDRAVDCSRVALANLHDILHSTPATAADKLAAREVADLDALYGFAKRGDKPNVENTLNRLKQNHEEAKRQAQEASTRATNQHDKTALAAAVRDLDSLFANLGKTSREAAASPNDKQKQLALEDSLHQMRKPIDVIQMSIKDSTTKSHFTAATAIIAGVRPRKMDARSLLDAANALAGHLSSLASDVSIQAHKNRDTATGKAAAALDLDSLLTQLDSVAASRRSAIASPASSAASMSALIGDLEVLAQASLPKGASLEASINHVAENLQRRSRATGGEATTGRHTANIGSELAKLADACKGGQRQQFLISARAISTFVRALSVDVKIMGEKCPDPELKERLMKSMQALQNYSIQLKILASVKAASNTPDPDADQQLAILTQNLGQMLTGTISAVNVAHLKYHVGNL